MLKALTPFVLTLILATTAIAAPQQITIAPTDGPSITAPIPFNFSDPTFTGDFSAVDDQGNKYPVTIINGRGIIVSPTSPTPVTYTLKKAKSSKLKIKKDKKQNRLDVTLGKELFTAYHYQDERVKPILWPLNAHDETPISRDWPMGDKNKTDDHPHHESFYTAYGDINDTDFWQFTSRKGYQTAQSVTFTNHAAYSTITSHILWHKEDGTPVLYEKRTYSFFNTPSESRIFDLSTTLSAAYGDAQFIGTKEGGMATVRMNDDLREKGGSGTITNSEGGVGAGETWGKPAAWCDYSGALDPIGNVGITIMDHPNSFRYPTHWHVRDYGLMGANAFGYSHFYGKDSGKNGDHLLQNGKNINFHYRVYIHTGNVQEAQVAHQYTQFATPAKVTIH